MARKKALAAKSETAEPSDSPEKSTSSVKDSPVATHPTSRSAQKNQRTSSTDSELPKVRAADQHPITSFFTRTPTKKKVQSDKGTQVVIEPMETEMLETTPLIPKVANKPKLTARKSTRKKSATKPRHDEPHQAPMREVRERPSEAPPKAKSEMRGQSKQSQDKKRKSEVESLDPPSPLPSRTRQKKSQSVPTQAPMSPAHDEPDPTPPVQPEVQLPPRTRTKQFATKTKAATFDTKQFYPFISLKAKTAFEQTLRGKLPIRERALDLEGADPFIKDIINSLGWQTFCGKPVEGALSLVKEFYANLESSAEGKVFARGFWIPLSSEEINKVIGAPDHDEDAYSFLMDQNVDPEVITRKLCKPDEEVIWATNKNNLPLSFPTTALLPLLVPLFKFICCRLIPTTHTSHVTMDRAVLLFAMTEKAKVDAGWVIYSNIIASPGPTKALWFPAIITQLCLNAGVKIAKGEEKVKAGLQISTKLTEEVPAVGGNKASTQILEELQQINKAMHQLTSFISQQQAWNKFMENAWTETIKSINPPIPAAGPSAPPKKSATKPKATVQKKSTWRKEIPESKGEQIATHLGGSDPLIGRFTSANPSSSNTTTD